LRWHQFLQLFGPGVQTAVRRLLKLRSKSWFKPFLSKQEAQAVLEYEPVGTYLVRLSDHDNMGAFSLAHKIASTVNHVLIRRRDDGQYTIRGEAGTEESFSSVSKLIKAHRKLLSRVWLSECLVLM
jgi:hypothetical protein